MVDSQRMKLRLTWPLLLLVLTACGAADEPAAESPAAAPAAETEANPGPEASPLVAPVRLGDRLKQDLQKQRAAARGREAEFETILDQTRDH